MVNKDQLELIKHIVESNKIELKKDIESLRSELKKDIETVGQILAEQIKTASKSTENALIKWLIGTAITVTGLVVTILKFWAH